LPLKEVRPSKKNETEVERYRQRKLIEQKNLRKIQSKNWRRFLRKCQRKIYC